MWKLVAAGCMAIFLQAEVIDRLVITVGRQSITELQLDEELRVTALLNVQPISRTREARRAAADRLVEQLLIKREMELSHYRVPASDDLAAYLAQVQTICGGPGRFQQLLHQYQLSEATVKEHLELQLAILHFVEYRFRSDAVSAASSIEQKIVEQQTDEALAAWLDESRKQVSIVYVDKSLQ